MKYDLTQIHVFFFASLFCIPCQTGFKHQQQLSIFISNAKFGKGSKQKGADHSLLPGSNILKQLGFWNPITGKNSAKDDTVNFAGGIFNASRSHILQHGSVLVTTIAGKLVHDGE